MIEAVAIKSAVIEASTPSSDVVEAVAIKAELIEALEQK